MPGSPRVITYQEWGELIQANFQNYFWVGDEMNPIERCPDLVNRKGIYKDCHGASQPWTDYQLRSNFPVTMVVVCFC